MSVKRGSTTFLKVIIFLAGIAVLALCIFLVPKMANFRVVSKYYPDEIFCFHCHVWSGFTFLHCSPSGF